MRTSIWGKTITKLIEPIAAYMYSINVRILKHCHPEWHSRRWSNAELRRWGMLFTGDIINVSGWDDRDKEGGQYTDYFPNKSSYMISNVGGERGHSDSENEIFLDLEDEVPAKLKDTFDVVFNHTTLEHIYDIRKAVGNLCSLSRDVVIVVAPFMQQVHWETGSFSDYWRFTPFALEKLFRENGFQILYLTHNDNPLFSIYFFCISTCNIEKWKHRFPKTDQIDRENAPGICWYQHKMPPQK